MVECRFLDDNKNCTHKNSLCMGTVCLFVSDRDYEDCMYNDEIGG
jgi:hypothetical protein